MSRRKSDYLDNPKTQIVFHKKMMKVWQGLTPIIALAYVCSFVFPAYAIQIIAGIGFVTCLLSLYANWDTDFGALSAAQASDKADPVMTDIAGGVADIQDTLRVNF